MSVRPSALDTSAPTGRIFVKSVAFVFFEKNIQTVERLIKIYNEHNHIRQHYLFIIINIIIIIMFLKG